ncbi:5466_t:CDS:2 [Entrophospora sp. SA101]|nr:5466_t:CDS:2 [Entrophospora sp. SA101]
MQILKAEISIIQNVILQILDNYSLNDLLKITKEDLKEVDKELIEQLFKLIKEKVRKKFASSEEDEGYYSQDDEKKNKENILFKKVYQEEEKRDRNKSKQSLQKSKTTETLKEQNSSPENEGYHLGDEEGKETLPTIPPSEDEDVYEFNEEEQKAFSLSDLEQLEQFFIKHDIKNVTLDGDNKLSELKQIIAEKKQEQLPSTNPTITYLTFWEEQ